MIIAIDTQKQSLPKTAESLMIKIFYTQAFGIKPVFFLVKVFQQI